ncbi:MAG TPA: High-affinity nickel-transporter [candidate division Zixibacteria bacterium]|nr:High-affinity nickel-transporter [candidate division Zixibacteria bacterium]
MIRALAAGALLLILLAISPSPVSAHPLGNFTVNHWVGVTVAAERVDVDIVMDVAEIPTIELMARIDGDRSGSLDRSERDAAGRMLCAERAPQVTVRVDGALLGLEHRAAEVEQLAGVGGLPTLRLSCALRASVETPQGASLSVVDGADPGRLGWREIVIRGDGMTVAPADQDVSRRLTVYPEGLLDRPLDERSAEVRITAGGPRLEVPAGGGSAAIPGGVADEIPGLPDLGDLGPGAALAGLLAAVLAGAGHAVSPGHGKTVMAAYLVGSRGRARHALLLGAAVTVSHTLGVLLLAAVVLLASDLLPPQRLYPVLTAASGVAVTVIGAWLLLACVGGWRRRRRHERAHAHGHAHHHDHDHDHGSVGQVPGVRGLLAIGIAGGLVPSTTALVLLLAAVSAGQPAYGLALALAFGTGMAAVLSGLGLAVVHGRERLGARLAAAGGRVLHGRLAPVAPWVVAVAVLAGGMLLTGQALATNL